MFCGTLSACLLFCWPASVLLALAAEESGPCTEEPLHSVRDFVSKHTFDILQRSALVIEPDSKTNLDEFLVLLARDLCAPVLAMLETFYLQVCQLAGCPHCAPERDEPSAKNTLWPEASHEGSFRVLFDRLRLFGIILQSAIDLAGEERERHKPSPLLEHMETVSAVSHRIATYSQDSPPLYLDKLFLHLTGSLDITDEQHAARTKELIEVSLSQLTAMHSQLAEVLECIVIIGREARHVPSDSSGLSYDSYKAYLQLLHTPIVDTYAIKLGSKKIAWPFTRNSALCGHADPNPSDTLPPTSRPSMDLSGLLTWNSAPPDELLRIMAKSNHPLSRTYWAVESSANFGQLRNCEDAKGLGFDATACIKEKGWAGNTYWVDPDVTQETRLFIQWHGAAWSGQRSEEEPVWEAWIEPLAAPPDPIDVLSMSPRAGNCDLLHLLLTAESMTMARLVYVPINPLVPPPHETQPNFSRFYAEHRAWLKQGGRSDAESAARYVQAQCSLERVCQLVRPLGYKLLHVEHFLAVFAHHSVAAVLHRARGVRKGKSKWPAVASPGHSTFEAWRVGWFCSPMSRYAFELELRGRFDAAWVSPAGRRTESFCNYLKLHRLVDGPNEKLFRQSCEASEERRIGRWRSARQRQQALWALTPAHPAVRIRDIADRISNKNTARASCDAVFESVCSCLPPYRGARCDIEDNSHDDLARSFRAAIAYVVHETGQVDADVKLHSETARQLAYSMASLWSNFNSQHDYPVLIFHASLDEAARELVALASPNRIWFQPVSALRSSAGAFAAASFETRGIFSHPAVTRLDYIWCLGPHSDFPESFVGFDFLAPLASIPTFQMGYRRVVTMPESTANHASVWEQMQLYLVERGLDIDGFFADPDSLGSVLADFQPGQLPVWNRQAISVDGQVFRVASFGEGTRYADFCAFLEAHATGSERYDAAVLRTIGVAVAVWGDGKSGAMGAVQVGQLDFPYSYGDYCSCTSPEDQVCERGSPSLSSEDLQAASLSGWDPPKVVWKCRTQ